MKRPYVPRIWRVGRVLEGHNPPSLPRNSKRISLVSPAEQKQRNASLSASRILRLVGKFSGFLRAYPNWLPPTQTIQTQTTSSSRVWTQSDARGVGWQAGTSSVSEAVHVPRSTNYFLGQYYFRKKQKRERIIKRSALLLSMYVPYECDPALIAGGSGILPN